MTLLRLDDPHAAGEWCARERARGRRLGFVPTMGALHEGHLSLVRRSAAENDLTCVSIFVNPLQFDDEADLRAYPRDLEGDLELLAGVGCSMAFTGTLAGFFPEVAGGPVPLRDPGPHAVGLEGAHRPGHFAGVATIVARLFECVHPDLAYFGEKDFQQSLVVRDLALALGYPRVVVCATSREADGLARSSRNVRLDAEGRQRALALSGALRAARAAYRDGVRDPEALRAALRAELDVPGVEREYAALRDPDAWGAGEPAGELPPSGAVRALVAARVQGVRLIDNLELGGQEGA